MDPGRARAFMAAAFLLVFGLGLPWIKIPGLELGGPLSTWIAISSDPQVLAAIYLLEVAIALAAGLRGSRS